MPEVFHVRFPLSVMSGSVGSMAVEYNHSLHSVCAEYNSSYLICAKYDNGFHFMTSHDSIGHLKL